MDHSGSAESSGSSRGPREGSVYGRQGFVDNRDRGEDDNDKEDIGTGGDRTQDESSRYQDLARRGWKFTTEVQEFSPFEGTGRVQEQINRYRGARIEDYLYVEERHTILEEENSKSKTAQAFKSSSAELENKLVAAKRENSMLRNNVEIIKHYSSNIAKRLTASEERILN